MKNIKIKRPYKLWKRGDREGVYYIKPKNGGPWKSTGSKDKDKAIELADAQCNHGDNENAMHHMKVAEAHLMNVQREVQNLNQRKQEIDQEIEKLTEYLNEGVQVVNTAKSEANAALAEQTNPPERDDDPPF